MVEVYAININEPIEKDLYNQFLMCVKDERRERIKKYHFIEDAKRTFYGELMIRYLVCKKFNITNSKINFCHNNWGKPSLQSYPDFHYNISHSGSWSVCVISGKEVGIDIEHIKKIDLDIAKRFFSPKEYNMLMSQPEELRIDYFYSLWTLKESYIKYVGKGLSIPLDSFCLNINKQTISIFPPNIPMLYFFQVLLEPKYKISICAEENILHSKIKRLTINDIKELLYGY